MFRLFEPRPFVGRCPRWAKKVPAYPLVFGLSSFGDIFLCSDDKRCIAIVRTEHPELVELNFESVEEFKRGFLDNADIRRTFLREPEYAVLRDKLGDLGSEECFYPVPYPAIGGSGEIDTYQKGDAWVHLDIYAQALGY